MRNLILILCFSPLFLNAQKIGNPIDNEQIIKGKDLYENPNFQLDKNYTIADVQAFLFNRYPQLQQKGVSLSLQTDKESLGGRHFNFIQHYNGIPLYNVSGKVNVNNQGEITSILQTFQNIENVDNISFSEIEINEFTANLKKNYHIYEIQTEYNYFFSLKDNTWLAVYKIITFSHTDAPRSMEYIVAAGTKEILQATDRSDYHHTHSLKIDGDTTGHGKVFYPDPITKSHSNYGNPIKDNSDQHLPMFDAYIYQVPLKNIYYDPTNQLFYLHGPYVMIEDIDPYATAPATSTNGDFFFTRDLSGFEDVMAYYHIDSMQRYMQSLGFQNIYNSPLRVDPHGWSNSDNSHFLANNLNPNQSYIGFGEGGVDDAEDTDVLVHEYGHAISYSAAPQTNTGLERKGLDEGIGDYMAAFRSYDNDFYDWDSTYTWDGHNEFWKGRCASTSVLYPPTVSQFGNIIYDYGQVWASTLMQIRQVIGGEAADKLFFEETYSNAANMTLTDAAHLYLDADTALYNGIHSPIILQYFCARNLLTGQQCANVGVETPVSATYKIYPNPASQGFTIDLGGATENVTIFDYTGKKFFEKRIDKKEYIDLLLSEGLYFVRIGEGNVVKEVIVR